LRRSVLLGAVLSFAMAAGSGVAAAQTPSFAQVPGSPFAIAGSSLQSLAFDPTAPLLAPPTTDPGVQPVSELKVSKFVDHRVARIGQRLTYTITISNSGPDAASDVRAIDTSRLPLRVLSIHPAQGNCQNGPPITCALGTLRAHALTTVTIVVVATVAGAETNTVAVTSASSNPEPRHGIAIARTRIVRARVHRPPRPPAVTG
jgi:uncharacterized repeat protein (TIGR01451 family)